jgi:hypothetical protein
MANTATTAEYQDVLLRMQISPINEAFPTPAKCHPRKYWRYIYEWKY